MSSFTPLPLFLIHLTWTFPFPGNDLLLPVPMLKKTSAPGPLLLRGNKTMDSLRIASREEVPDLENCSRCQEAGRRWDRIAGTAYCPNCQEQLIQGEGPPLILRTEKQRCAICDGLGTVAFLTFPLQARSPLEMQLCPEHLRALVGRWLEPHAFHQLRRQLQAIGVDAEEVFLLHGAFYDSQGHASMPAVHLE